jgi:hypothetical protein
MATERKAHDVVLPEVRKPAGYGRLVAVVPAGDACRELWFQHEDESDIVRMVRVTLTGDLGKPITITTRGKRERTHGFKF